MNTYETVRNFIRYPFSTLKLAKNKNFVQNQKSDNDIDYMELRKIMQRIFKLHRNCENN